MGLFRDSCPAVDLAKWGTCSPTVHGFVLRASSPRGVPWAGAVPGRPTPRPRQRCEESAVCAHPVLA